MRYLPDTNIFIAASAVEAEAILITDDRALLDNAIPDLSAKNWRD